MDVWNTRSPWRLALPKWLRWSLPRLGGNFNRCGRSTFVPPFPVLPFSIGGAFFHRRCSSPQPSTRLADAARRLKAASGCARKGPRNHGDRNEILEAESMSSRVLVTGAGGFIGHHLVNYL